MKNESFVSVVCIIPNAKEKKLDKVKRIHEELESNFTDFEIVLLTENSMRDSQSNALQEILDNLSCIRLIHLSGSIDRDVMYAAGTEFAVGDFVILFNLESDPTNIILPLFKKCSAGHDVVTGVATSTKTVAYKVVRSLFSFLLKGIEYGLPEDSTELRCLSRRAVNSVTRTGRYHHRFFARIQKSGYSSATFKYDYDLDFNELKDIPKMSRFFLSLLVFNSTRPLRWVSTLGAIGSFVAFLYASFSVLSHFISGQVADGWTTTILFISSLFMIQFVILSFLGEYLVRILDDRSEKNDVSVVFEKNSSVMINADRVNVLDCSVSEQVNKVQTGRDR
ncbi:TPA: glycosyl transferase family 2 [Vibrio cholerae]|nr:glycosyl transferase family 2 [Vibrio cholerae]